MAVPSAGKAASIQTHRLMLGKEEEQQVSKYGCWHSLIEQAWHDPCLQQRKRAQPWGVAGVNKSCSEKAAQNS